MILRDFPRPCPLPGWPNMIIAAAGREVEYSEHSGPLSVKCVFSGHEVHEVQRARFVVDPGAYLILNHGRCYASSIRSETEVETLSIFFRQGFAEEVLASLVTPHDRLLEDPVRTPDQPVAFVEKLFPHDQTVTPIVAAIRSACRQGTVGAGWLEERFHQLLEALLAVHRGLYPEIEALPSARRTTRVELYRRLHRARDFMESNLAEPLTLPEIAGVACLSTHHFLRLFKQAFGRTPHQYLTRRRIRCARLLLASTDRPVTEICWDVGFCSLSSFSNLFRRRTGVSPSEYRRRGLEPGAEL